MRLIQYFILFFFSFFISVEINAQNDSAAQVRNTKIVLLDALHPKKDSVTAHTPKKDSTTAKAQKDSVARKKHDPHKATIRSAILPGLGQAYNHQYWKIPIVYGALAVPASLFVYNNTWYQRTKDAYEILVNAGDSSKIHPDLVGIPPSYLQQFRNEFRKDRDYSALFFLLIWGLNIVDATVSAHLKDFDVSDDLSMHIEPGFNPATKTPSLSLAFNFKTKTFKPLPASF